MNEGNVQSRWLALSEDERSAMATRMGTRSGYLGQVCNGYQPPSRMFLTLLLAELGIAPEDADFTTTPRQPGRPRLDGSPPVSRKPTDKTTRRRMKDRRRTAERCREIVAGMLQARSGDAA